MSNATPRLPLIDALKAVAALLVLLNHFSSYGPLGAAAQAHFPALFGWLFDYGRMAVQVFLVVAGFLAARALSPNGEALLRSPWSLIGRRYLRLVVPLLLALALAIVAAAIADRWLDDDMIPARAHFAQWLAHLLLLQSLLGFESLSAGVWYIAIDFQLFALMALLLWGGRIRRVAPVLVLVTATLSLFWFNRNPGWDDWAIYFFGAYGLGAAAWWASDRRQLASWLGVIATVTSAALIVDFRLRLLLALLVALVLGFARRFGLLERWPESRSLAFLGQISYSLFLVHFPVLLLTNSVYARYELTHPASSLAVFLLGLIFTLVGSLIAATVFHHSAESPVASKRLTDALRGVWEGGLNQVRKMPLLGSLLPARGLPRPKPSLP